MRNDKIPFQKILFQKSKCTVSEDMCTVKPDHGGSGGVYTQGNSCRQPGKANVGGETRPRHPN